jgi:hypothetical protein
MKVSIIILLLFFARPASAVEVLQFECLENYQQLLNPVAEIQDSSGLGNKQKNALPDAVEYKGSLPASCPDELKSSGTLKFIQYKKQLYVLEMTFKNPKPIFLRFFPASTISRMEIAYRKSGYAGSQFLSHINDDLILNYTISTDVNHNYIEQIRYKSIETANYE